MGRACRTHWVKRNAYRILVGKPEEKRPLGRPRRSWENNIKMYLKETGRNSTNWVHLAEDREQWRVFVNIILNLRIP
jgi:hypothetical protein